MLIGLSGTLLSHHFAERLLSLEFAGQLGERSCQSAHKRLGRWWTEHGVHLGPASSTRSIWDRAAAPLAEILGFKVERVDLSRDDVRCSLLTHENARVGLIAGRWNDSLETLWRAAVRAGINFGAPWCLCTNGRELRLVDAFRTYSRAHLQFELEHTVSDPRTFAAFWGVLRAETFVAGARDGSLLFQIIRTSARHGHAVSRSLRFGVIDAVQELLGGLLDLKLRRRPGPTQADLLAGFDESLTIVYRVLFLMFAEARGLVPTWHPIYRESYTIESLRDAVEGSDNVTGLWETLQAIARLAHRGCRAGTLVVPPFNGRLFSPARTPMAEGSAVDNGVARRALIALSTTSDRKVGRSRIDYRDLGVEQLGAIYESVLEYVPAFTQSAKPPLKDVQLRRGSDRRKSTGSFYTPQSITDYVVRRTLHPLVEGITADHILRLRIVDPAMGSAAFLVSACLYLARAYEQALVREGACGHLDIHEPDRAHFRRQIAQRCLFGVDLNPTAVQLARLSLWLATLSAGKPLTFLDHHLVCGDSLIGASPIDLARRPPPRDGRLSAQESRHLETPLFSDLDLEPSLARAVLERRWLSDTADDTLEIVREKEKRLDRLNGALRWKELADLWCACWMWPDRGSAPGPAVYASLVDALTRSHAALPENVAVPLLERSREIARNNRFLHWMLEFPEVYFDEDGEPLPNGGFDAVLGNPPWDMLRADSGEARDMVRSGNILTKQFFRHSGVYRHLDGGHINRYQVFLERALALTKRGGRVGFLLPSGFATDHTSSSLRRRLIEQTDVDTLTGFDNRRAIFPIHRSVRFVICTCTNGRPTLSIKCRFGIDDPQLLERVPDTGDRQHDPIFPVVLTPTLIKSLAGEKLAIPDLRSSVDLAIVERIVHRFPRLADADGWNARFGRELNATDDRRHFHSGGSGLPVLEGKHLEAFRVYVERSRQRIAEQTAARLLDPARSYKRPRLAYRDVASSTNRMSLIAAILPPGVVTTHSLFCLKTFLAGDDQEYLCGMLNSFVANYLIRQVMTTHLGSTTVEQLRVPKLDYDSSAFKAIVDLAVSLRAQTSARDAARLQALAARSYELTVEDFRHVLSTFPLVSNEERDAALEEFVRC